MKSQQCALDKWSVSLYIAFPEIQIQKGLAVWSIKKRQWFCRWRFTNNYSAIKTAPPNRWSIHISFQLRDARQRLSMPLSHLNLKMCTCRTEFLLHVVATQRLCDHGIVAIFVPSTAFFTYHVTCAAMSRCYPLSPHVNSQQRYLWRLSGINYDRW